MEIVSGMYDISQNDGRIEFCVNLIFKQNTYKHETFDKQSVSVCLTILLLKIILEEIEKNA